MSYITDIIQTLKNVRFTSGHYRSKDLNFLLNSNVREELIVQFFFFFFFLKLLLPKKHTDSSISIGFKSNEKSLSREVNVFEW